MVRSRQDYESKKLKVLIRRMIYKKAMESPWLFYIENLSYVVGHCNTICNDSIKSLNRILLFLSLLHFKIVTATSVE